MELRPYSYFRWCGYFWGPWVPFVMTDEFSVRVTKITSRIGVSWTHSLPCCFWQFLIQWIMVILSKGLIPDNFESHDFLKLNFTNICGLSSHFIECESYLESNSPEILALCGTNSYAWSCSLCEGRTSFCTGIISRKLYGFLHNVFDWFYYTQYHLLHLYAWFLILFYLKKMRLSWSTHLLICLSLETLSSS